MTSIRYNFHQPLLHHPSLGYIHEPHFTYLGARKPWSWGWEAMPRETEIRGPLSPAVTLHLAFRLPSSTRHFFLSFVSSRLSAGGFFTFHATPIQSQTTTLRQIQLRVGNASCHALLTPIRCLHPQRPDEALA